MCGETTGPHMKNLTGLANREVKYTVSLISKSRQQITGLEKKNKKNGNNSKSSSREQLVLIVCEVEQLAVTTKPHSRTQSGRREGEEREEGEGRD